MIRILHLSDIHMAVPGSPALENKTLSELQALKPDITIVTGDSSQGSNDELSRVREWIDKLPGEKIVVPGNTDTDIYGARYSARRAEGTLQDEERHKQKYSLYKNYHPAQQKEEEEETEGLPPIILKDQQPLTKEELESIAKNGYEFICTIKINDDMNHYLVRERNSRASSTITGDAISTSKSAKAILPRDHLSNFHRHFSDLIAPIITPEVLVFGFDSTAYFPIVLENYSIEYEGKRAYLVRIHDGAIHDSEIEAMKNCLGKCVSPARLNIAAIHHPLKIPAWSSNFGPFYNADALLKSFAELGVNAILAGHKHTTEIRAIPSWNPPYIPTLYQLVANTLFHDDIKHPYKNNSHFIIDKDGKDVQIFMRELSKDPIKVAGFELTN